MTAIGIYGLGLAGGFGTGVAAFLEALATGGPGPGTYQLPGGIAFPAFLADDTPLARFLPLRALRRTDHFSRLGLLGANLALEDAGLLGADLSRLGVVVASGLGATGSTLALVDAIIQGGDPCASPIHFANSLHNAAAANIALHLKAEGPNLTVSQFHLSTASALLTARQWLLEGRTDRILFGAVEELSELVGYLHHRQPGPPPGEGAAFFLLSTREEAAPAYASLQDARTGWGPPGGFPADHLVLGGPYPGVQGATLSCFSSLGGSMPAAPALDLAAAVLMARHGRTFPSQGPGPFTPGGCPLGAGRITALHLGDGGGFGSVSVASQR